MTIHSVCRGVPEDKSLIYLPTEADIRAICLEHYTKRENFFDDIPYFHLQEQLGRVQTRNLQFNVEFAKITGTEINLSKR